MKGKFNLKLIPALLGGGVLCVFGTYHLVFSQVRLFHHPGGKSAVAASGFPVRCTEPGHPSLLRKLRQRGISPSWMRWPPGPTEMAAFLDMGQVDQVYLLENRQVERVAGSASSARPAISAVSDFLGRQDNSVLGLVPSAWTVYEDQLPNTPDLLDEGQLMVDAYSAVDKTRTVDLYSVLTSVQDDNLYYTTDNRLTGYGSYLCYRSLIRALGQSALGLESFDIRHVQGGIYGNLYRRTMIPTGPGDTLDEYYSNSGGTVEQVNLQYDGYTTQSHSLYFPEYLNTGDPMSYYLGSGWGIAEIRTDSSSQRSLLVITDDFSNSIIPFLSLHYRQITVVHLSDATQEQLASLHPEKFSSTLLLFSIQQLTDGNELASRLQQIGTAP